MTHVTLPPVRDLHRPLPWGRWGVALAALGLASVVATEAHAQPTIDIDDQLALARVCASEAGLDASAAECAAIHQVLDRRARRLHTSLTDAARAYSTRVFDPARRDARAWLAHLRPDGTEPARWPTMIVALREGVHRVLPHAPWEVFRVRWLRLYADAGRVVRGQQPCPCEFPVDHWGMRSGIDLERAQRAGWVEVSCGPTRNAFWRIPPRSVRRAEEAAAAERSSAGTPSTPDTSGSTAPP